MNAVFDLIVEKAAPLMSVNLIEITVANPNAVVYRNKTTADKCCLHTLTVT
jgi:hypothetical protein